MLSGSRGRGGGGLGLLKGGESFTFCQISGLAFLCGKISWNVEPCKLKNQECCSLREAGLSCG